MATPISDVDRYLGSNLDASTPYHLIDEGSIVRLMNGRFTKGAITNALGFDEVPMNYIGGPSARFSASPASYQDMLDRGDPQLLAPIKGADGAYIVFVVSGRMFLLDPRTHLARDFTPLDAALPRNAWIYQLSYIGNDGGSEGVGGTLVIFNGPNRPLFVNARKARKSARALKEMMPARLGVTAANRAFVFSANNIMWASDPVGLTPEAPLTFSETYDPSTGFTGQYFLIGPNLDGEFVTGAIRLPKLLGPSTSFIAQNLIVSTKDHKYIIAAENARTTWGAPGTQFQTYAGANAGFAGPWASCVMGTQILDVSWQGRIKTLAQDQEKDTSMFESYFDDKLGQYMNLDESDFTFREWYELLDHSRSSIRFVGNRVFATVYPTGAPGFDTFGQYVQSYTHRALAVSSIASETTIGPVTSLAWEGFYDWFQPALTMVLGSDFYVLTKSSSGENKLLVLNQTKRDTHCTVIYTRGYFGAQEDTTAKLKTLLKGQLYFRRIWGSFPVRIYQLIDSKWVLAASCFTNGSTLDFTIAQKEATPSFGIPLRIELDHQGCVFELESIRVQGEAEEGF